MTPDLKQIQEPRDNQWRVLKAFQMIDAAHSVTILSLEEMQAIVLRALDGEFDAD